MKPVVHDINSFRRLKLKEYYQANYTCSSKFIWAEYHHCIWAEYNEWMTYNLIAKSFMDLTRIIDKKISGTYR